MTSPANLTREQVIAQLVSELQGPIPLETLVDRVLQRKPSRAKDPRSPIRGEIRMYADRLGIVFADPERKTVVPANIAMRGVRFRHVITDAEISNRLLLWDESDFAYFPRPYLQSAARRDDLQIVDVEGRPLAEERRSVPMRFDTSIGPIIRDIQGRKISAILRQYQVRAGDAFLFTIEQFDPPRWRLEHEPQAQRNEAAIARRNRELMDLLYQMLEATAQERLHSPTALRCALIQMGDPAGYPGDPWLAAMKQDGRMKYDMSYIFYADDRRRNAFDALESLLFPEDDQDDELEGVEAEDLPPLPEGAAERIYTFKVSPTYRSELWRRVEVLGACMLMDLSDFLVELFKHETDHMAGFWKLVRRGKSNRTREVELAHLTPIGTGEGSELRVAELDLPVGGALKWVYDFGDWYEYKLQLEAVAQPEAAPSTGDYPRVVGANKPKLLYCASCQAQGKRIVAVWCCWDCSNEQGETVMLCEACSRRPEHQDHYLEEWVY